MGTYQFNDGGTLYVPYNTGERLRVDAKCGMITGSRTRRLRAAAHELRVQLHARQQSGHHAANLLSHRQRAEPATLQCVAAELAN